MSTDAAAVLREAAAILERDGHCKGELFNSAGEHCAMGALNEAQERLGGFDFSHTILQAVTEHAGITTPSLTGLHPLAAWNDLPEATMQDVQKLFLQTADELEFAE